MQGKNRSVYRGWHNKTSLPVKIIIGLLIVLVITLAALLFKDRISKWFEPDVTYPDTSVTGQADTKKTAESVPDGTEEEQKIKLTRISASDYDSSRGPLIIVNAQNAYVFKDGDKELLTDLYTSDHRGFSLASASESLLPEAYSALYRMTGKYADMYGFCPIMVTSSYRDYESQEQYYKNNATSEQNEKYYEKPGYSDHHTGYSFDVKIYDEKGDSYSYVRYGMIKAEWITEHYMDYGFIIRYPANKAAVTGIDGEGNHFRYVGLPHSAYITENLLCLEEYENMIRRHGKDDPFEYEYNGIVYLVWYCSAEDGYIDVPLADDFTVSGDNCGGFIVTASKMP